MTRTARVGYVGVDHHHRDPYLGATKRLPVEVVACCEPDRSYTAADVRTHVDRPDEIPAEGVDVGRVVEGATFYEDPETMLDDAELDVLWVTYRNDAVPGIVDAAVEAGVDVLSEKPVARTAADLEPVAERAAAAGVTVGATYFYRYNPVAKALKRRVEAGLFGDVWSVEGRYVGSKLEYRDTDHYLYDDAVSRGGALQWVGLHWVDLFGYVLDDPIAAVCARSTPADADVDVEAGMTLQFETVDGVAGTFQTGYYLGEPVKDTRFAVYGREATAESPVHHDPRGDGNVVPLSLRSDALAWTDAPGRRVEFEFGYERFPMWGNYVLDFFSDFFTGRESGSVPANVEDALRVLRVLDAAYESAAGGGWVTVEKG